MQSSFRFSGAFDALHEAATAQTGLNDFGSSDYHEGMRRALESFDTDVPFTDAGRKSAFDALVRTLVARLFTEEGWKRHPEYARVNIPRPLVITGLPRTGSTALHKLLSMDPQFQGLDMWLTATPMVRPPRDSWESNPWYRNFVEAWSRVLATMPELNTMHEITADSVDECVNVLQQSFVSNRFAASYGATGYEAWWWHQDEGASYRRYADVLRLIGLADQDKRWLLKNPGHLWGMESLFEIFPDVCVIQTHRDPAKIVPSVCSLLATSRRPIVGNNQKLKTLGLTEALKWLHALHRADPVRRRHEDRFYDVRQKDFLADPMAVVQGIYARFNLNLTEFASSRMRHWLENQLPEQKDGHRYEAETFGLSESGLRELFADYIERYGLAPTSKTTV